MVVWLRRANRSNMAIHMLDRDCMQVVAGHLGPGDVLACALVSKDFRDGVCAASKLQSAIILMSGCTPKKISTTVR